MGDEGQAVNKTSGDVDISNAKTEVDALRVSTDSVVNRRSRWLSSLSALKYVGTVAKDEDIKVRDSDRATAIALLACCFAALSCLLIPQLENHRIGFVLAADALVGLSLLMYVANRFGIVTTFQPRQALLTWQLMLGSSLLGIFFTINLALILAFCLQNAHIVIAR